RSEPVHRQKGRNRSAHAGYSRIFDRRPCSQERLAFPFRRRLFAYYFLLPDHKINVAGLALWFCSISCVENSKFSRTAKPLRPPIVASKDARAVRLKVSQNGGAVR